MDAGYLAESCSNTLPDGKWRGEKMREAHTLFTITAKSPETDEGQEV